LSGGHEVQPETSELIKELVEKFKVNEETAQRIISWANAFALEKFKKWRINYTRRVMYKLKKEEEKRDTAKSL